MRGWFVLSERDGIALGAAAVLLGTAYVLAHPLVTYGAWLAVFAVWMAWFVFTAVEWISNANF